MHVARPTLSVVIPAYDEAANLGPLLARLRPVLAAIAHGHEIIVVDDGSTDGTGAVAARAGSRDPRVKLITLSRNFGKEAAIAAGLRFARGEAVVIMDGDLQHPPETIEAMVARWREGYEVVFARRADRDADPWLRRAATRLFYALFARLGSVQLPEGAGDFRLLDRRVVTALAALPERTRFTKGLYAWVGFRQIAVSYAVDARADGGQSHWRLIELGRHALDGITSFSLQPLRLATLTGAAVSIFAGIYAVIIIGKTIVLGRDVHGYPSLIVTVLFLGGVQLLSLGIIGEYVGRIFMEVKRRPIYLIAGTQGIDPPEPVEPPVETRVPTPAE